MTAPNQTRSHRIGRRTRSTSDVMASSGLGNGTATRETYRGLLLRGLSPGEAANLTAFLNGIHVTAGRPWRLADIDRLLFLRELCRTGRVGADDGYEPIAALPAS